MINKKQENTTVTKEEKYKKKKLTLLIDLLDVCEAAYLKSKEIPHLKYDGLLTNTTSYQLWRCTVSPVVVLYAQEQRSVI